MPCLLFSNSMSYSALSFVRVSSVLLNSSATSDASCITSL